MNIGIDLKGIQEFKDELEKFKENIKIAKEKVEEEAPKKVKFDLDLICERAIDKFYESYTPYVYERTESLYKAANIIAGKGKIYIEVNGDRIGGHRLPGAEIYDLTIGEGWHGGAKITNKLRHQPSVGVPYYRTPVPYYSEWGSPAARTSAPIDEIQSELDNYDFSKIATDIFNRYFKF